MGGLAFELFKAMHVNFSERKMKVPLFLKLLLGLCVALFLSLSSVSFADSPSKKVDVEKSSAEKSPETKKSESAHPEPSESAHPEPKSSDASDDTKTPPTTREANNPDRNVAPGAPSAPQPGAPKAVKESLVVKSPITSNNTESSTNKFLKNSSNLKSYLAGNSYTKVTTTGTIKSFTQPKNGSVVNVSGELRFTPDAKFKGLTSFTYTSVNAAGETEIHEVQITVENKAPLLMSALESPTKSEEAAWTTTDKSLTFTSLDPNGDPYKVKIGVPNKDVRVNLSGGKLTMAAPQGFSGNVDVDITAADNDNGITVITARFVVNPAAATGTSLLTVSKELHVQSGLNQMFEFASIVSFKKSANATGLALAVNGIDQGYQSDHDAKVVLPEPVGTKDNLMMKMLGNDSTESKSVKVPVTVALGVPVAHVNFDNDSWALTAGARMILDELAAAAAHLNVSAFDLVGHADANIGKNTNQTLSDKRAAVVKAYLLAAMKAEKISGVTLKVAGKSDSRPVASNKSAGGLAQNRRVDISLPTP